MIYDFKTIIEVDWGRKEEVGEDEEWSGQHDQSDQVPFSVLQNHQEGINTIRTNHTCTDNTWGEALTMGRTHMEEENMNVKLVIF